MIALKNEDQVVCGYLTTGRTPTRSTDRAIRYVTLVVCDGSKQPPRNRIWRSMRFPGHPRKQAHSLSSVFKTSIWRKYLTVYSNIMQIHATLETSLRKRQQKPDKEVALQIRSNWILNLTCVKMRTTSELIASSCGTSEPDSLLGDKSQKSSHDSEKKVDKQTEENSQRTNEKTPVRGSLIRRICMNHLSWRRVRP